MQKDKVIKEPLRPTLKQLFSKENLTSYIEANRTKSLAEFQRDKP